MAEKQEKKPEAAAPATEKKGKGGGLLTKTPVLLGGVMVIEAVVLFAGFKFLGSSPRSAPGRRWPAPRRARAVTRGPRAAAPRRRSTKTSRSRSTCSISARRTRPADAPISTMSASSPSTKAGKAEKVKEILKQREALIQDRIRTIIAQSDPDKLGGGQEPGLETLRRQVKYQLDEIVGEGMIDEVLVPKCIPFRTEF